METQNDDLVDALYDQVSILKKITIDVNKHIREDVEMLGKMVRFRWNDCMTLLFCS
jgi:hypothetical protein